MLQPGISLSSCPIYDLYVIRRCRLLLARYNIGIELSLSNTANDASVWCVWFEETSFFFREISWDLNPHGQKKRMKIFLFKKKGGIF